MSIGSCLACIGGTVLCPVAFMAYCFNLSPKEEAVVLRCGRYESTVREPGLHCSNFCGRELLRVSVKLTSLELPRTSVVDASGCPIQVSAVVVYEIVDSRRAMLDVEDVFSFIRSQSETVLRSVVSRFPYESTDGSTCLKNECGVVSEQLRSTLQQRVDVAGCSIRSFVLREISYAQEIAASMLRRQQASALLEARQTIVRGAVDIASSALGQLAARGIVVSDTEKARIVTNLLTVICGEQDAQPTLTL
jgi:regulator of protease activity HflC (stomatin/prohibitin superfamily)